MKFYNLCDEEENKLFKMNISYASSIRKYDDMCNEFLYFYVDSDCIAARLDGPAFQYKDSLVKKFLINHEYISEEDYWNHPDVIAYKYLKEHPELDAFI